MFKPELWQSHHEYRTLVTTVGRRLSRNNPKYSFNLYIEERDKLLNLDLDPLLDLIPAYYSDAGRPAHSTGHSSYAHWYFLSCSLIKPRLAQALLPGSGKSFPLLFPYRPYRLFFH